MKKKAKKAKEDAFLKQMGYENKRGKTWVGLRASVMKDKKAYDRKACKKETQDICNDY